jgi:hypothetical protein
MPATMVEGGLFLVHAYVQCLGWSGVLPGVWGGWGAFSQGFSIGSGGVPPAFSLGTPGLAPHALHCPPWRLSAASPCLQFPSKNQPASSTWPGEHRGGAGVVTP